MKEVVLQTLVSVGGSSGRRDVIFPIPGGGLLGERPMVPGGRERTEREEQLQRQVEGDAAQGPVVEAKKGPSAPSLDEWDGHVTLIDGWKHHLDYAFMGRETEDRASPILVGKFSKDR